MREMAFKDAIALALREEMERDDSVFLMGEDIGVYGGAFGVTAGLLDQFGPQRVLETPISESSLMGIATGSSLMGRIATGLSEGGASAIAVLLDIAKSLFADFATRARGGARCGTSALVPLSRVGLSALPGSFTDYRLTGPCRSGGHGFAADIPSAQAVADWRRACPRVRPPQSAAR